MRILRMGIVNSFYDRIFKANKALFDTGCLGDKMYKTSLEERFEAICASGEETFSCISMLIGFGGEIYAEDDLGYTPLHSAIEGNNFTALVAFIHAGADVNRKYERFRGETIMHFAVGKKKDEMVGLLLQLGGNVNARDWEGKTLLHKAASEGYLPMIKYLSKMGGSLRAKDHNGQTLLHWTSERNFFDATLWLLENGVDVEAKDARGWTPLHMAAWWGNRAIAEVLLIWNAETGAKTREARSPLHLAAWQGHADLLKLLLGWRASINSRDEFGRTPLYYANQYRHSRRYRHDTAAVDLLKSRGGIL